MDNVYMVIDDKWDPTKECLIHSDQGFQYTNIEYIRYLDEHGATVSHSRKANCYDNACCENFFGHLKSEYLELKDIPKTNDELISMVDRYIHFYNYERPQRKLKGMTPMEYRESYLNS
jgi:transposase InsO family protein